MSTVLDTTTVPGTQLLYRLARLLAIVSGTFCVCFCLLLAENYFGLRDSSNAIAHQTETILSSEPSYRKPAEDSFNRLPTDYQTFLALRQKLMENRQDEELKTQIRHLDLFLRTHYFNRRRIAGIWTYCLLCSSVLFFVAVRTSATLKRQIPDPNEVKQQSEKKDSWGFAAATAWFMLCVGLFAGLLFAPPLPMEHVFVEKLAHLAAVPATGTPAPSGTTPAQATLLPAIELTEELLAKNWVSFRNYNGNGIGFSDNPPIHWDGTTGKNIIWKTEVPLPGNSSPVIWDEKLFLSCADENTQKLFCYNIENGELLWEKDVTQTEAKLTEDKISADTGFAAPTPAVDARHVYALFGNGEIVAVDHNGQFVWRKSLGIPDIHYGFSSSLALYFDRLIVQFDNGDGEDGKSKIMALDLSTGETLWETPRELPDSWSSPTIKKIDDSYQIITCGNPYVIAYNPEDGTEIWRAKRLYGEVAPTAVSFGDIVLVTQDPLTTAIDATGTGDVTTTHVCWEGRRGAPDSVSPLATQDYFMTLNSYGFLTGYDPNVINPGNKRARYWELELGEQASFYSSPLLVGNYIYAFDKSEEGAAAFVIDLSKIVVDDKGNLTEESAKAMIIAENPMSEPCVTSPAMLNNRLYIRGETAVYCIGEK